MPARQDTKKGGNPHAGSPLSYPPHKGAGHGMRPYLYASTSAFTFWNTSPGTQVFHLSSNVFR